jgi:hypothetical protein
MQSDPARNPSRNERLVLAPDRQHLLAIAAGAAARSCTGRNESSHRRMRRSAVLRTVLLGAGLLCAASPAAAQERAPRTGWEFAGLPALNYDSDEGFGYGFVAEVYDYGRGGFAPYRLTLQPTVQFTTEGRRDLTVFLDSPHLLPGGWRLNAFLGSEKHIATPYYGTGNRTAYDPALDSAEGSDPYFYRYGRTRNGAVVNVQRGLGTTPLRLLIGASATHVTLDPTPKDRGTTLLAEEIASTDAALPGGWTNAARVGIVWDSRDREVAPRRGAWSEVIVQRADGRIGSESSFTRWSATDRRYLPLGGRLTCANRLVLQGTSAAAPLYELQTLQGSFKQQEGLGGAKSIRGLPKNRYTGGGLFLWNAELRWRAADFQARGRPFHVVLTGFADSGRVWDAGSPRIAELASELHHGVGGGLRLGMGENFVVAVDVGHSRAAAAPFYIGLGYLY